jgi:hypothetical protein
MNEIFCTLKTLSTLSSIRIMPPHNYQALLVINCRSGVPLECSVTAVH